MGKRTKETKEKKNLSQNNKYEGIAEEYVILKIGFITVDRAPTRPGQLVTVNCSARKLQGFKPSKTMPKKASH